MKISFQQCKFRCQVHIVWNISLYNYYYYYNNNMHVYHIPFMLIYNIYYYIVSYQGQRVRPGCAGRRRSGGRRRVPQHKAKERRNIEWGTTKKETVRSEKLLKKYRWRRKKEEERRKKKELRKSLYKNLRKNKEEGGAAHTPLILLQPIVQSTENLFQYIPISFVPEPQVRPPHDFRVWSFRG